MSNEKMTICLEDFLKYLLRKWKVILPVSLLCAMAFLGVSLKLGKEISVEPSEKFIYLSEQESAMKDYMENSVIMKMDAQNVYKRIIKISSISNIDFLKGFITSGEIWKNKEEHIPLEYIMETLVWEKDVATDEAQIKIQHYDAGMCSEYAEYIVTRLQEYDTNIQVTLEEQEISADDAVLMTQLGKYDLEHKIESELEIAATGYTIHVSPIAAIAVGIFFGAFISIVILFFKYLFKDQWK